MENDLEEQQWEVSFVQIRTGVAFWRPKKYRQYAGRPLESFSLDATHVIPYGRRQNALRERL